MKKENIFKYIGAGFLSALMLFSSAEVVSAESVEYAGPNNMIINTESYEDDEYEVITEEEYKLKLKQKKKSSFIARVRNTVLLTGSLGISLIAKLILGFATSVLAKGLGASANTLFGFIADCIVNFIILAVLFAIAYKIIYPKKSLKELFKLKNVLYLLIASVLMEILQSILDVMFRKAYIFNQIAQCIFNISIIGFVWFKTFELKGIFGKTIKEAIHSKYGRKLFLVLALGSILAVAFKVMFRDIHALSGYVQAVFVFVTAALIIICGCGLFRPKKKLIILK